MKTKRAPLHWSIQFPVDLKDAMMFASRFLNIINCHKAYKENILHGKSRYLFFPCTATFIFCYRDIDNSLVQERTLNNRKQLFHLVLRCPIQRATKMLYTPLHEQWSNKEVQYKRQRWALPIEFRYSENLNVCLSSALVFDVLSNWRTTEVLHNVHTTHLAFCSSWTDVGHQGSPFNTTFAFKDMN